MNTFLKILLSIVIILVIILLVFLVLHVFTNLNSASESASQALTAKEEDNNAGARFAESLGDFMNAAMALDEAKTEEEQTAATTSFIDSYIDMIVDGMKMTSEW